MQALPDGTVIRFGLKWLPKNSSLYCFPLEKLWFHQENKSLVRKLNYKVWYIATRQQSLRVTLVLGLQLVSAYDVGGHEEILKTSESFSEVVCLSHSQQRNNRLGLARPLFFFFFEKARRWSYLLFPRLTDFALNNQYTNCLSNTWNQGDLGSTPNLIPALVTRIVSTFFFLIQHFEFFPITQFSKIG